MKKIVLYVVILGLWAVFPIMSVRADVVELDNGSRIVGVISKIDGESLVIQTDFAGAVTINLVSVLSYKTETPLHLLFPGNNRVFGKVTYSNGQTRVEPAGSRDFVSAAPLLHAWPEGVKDPLGRHWSFEVGLDVAGKTGNAERVSTGGRALAKRQGPDDRLLLYLRYGYAKDEGIESDNAIIGGVDFESYFKEKHSWYARIEMEYDRIRKIDLRTTAAAGYGYFFLKKPHHTLRGRTGLMLRHDELRDQSAATTFGLDLGLSHLYRFDNAWKILNDVTYMPSLEDHRDYRIYHESLFEIPLVSSDIWKLQVGMTNDYVSRPADAKDYLDTTYFGRLVFSWQ